MSALPGWTQRSTVAAMVAQDTNSQESEVISWGNVVRTATPRLGHSSSGVVSLLLVAALAVLLSCSWHGLEWFAPPRPGATSAPCLRSLLPLARPPNPCSSSHTGDNPSSAPRSFARQLSGSRNCKSPLEALPQISHTIRRSVVMGSTWFAPGCARVPTARRIATIKALQTTAVCCTCAVLELFSATSSTVSRATELPTSEPTCVGAALLLVGGGCLPMVR
mmetsp:Transcript_92962/g.248802  ORF Transcript_92962/g.248802 Transcript_92962/m.248802 type:complete len:221 (-) Transcript_92962:216-878(-)